jgi:hypothetical protein
MREKFLSKARDRYGHWVTGYYIYMGVINEDKVSMRMEHMILSMKNDDPESLTQTVILIETLCQCTGLWDDTGRLIYEDDKLSVKLDTKNEFETSVFCINGKFVISYPRGDMFGIPFRDLADCCDYGHGGKYNVVCKIIGNIN